MDFALIRTFLEVAATGSFAAASDRLYVTQSAVSLRIQRLEEELGRPLFIRSKTGAELTTVGRDFQGYAVSLLRSWEEARQQVQLPEGFSRSVTIGAELPLWQQLGLPWLMALRKALPDLSIRAEIGSAEELSRAMAEGRTQLALTSAPTLRPGTVVRRIVDEELVLVAPWQNPRRESLGRRYAYVDWGSDFLHFHRQHLLDLADSGLTLAPGVFAGDLIIQGDFAAYLPLGNMKRYLDQGRLYLVPEAPSYAYPVWAVRREDVDSDLITVAEKLLSDVAETLRNDVAGLREQH